MRHLCSACASLSVDEPTILLIRKGQPAPPRIRSTLFVAREVSEPYAFHSSASYYGDRFTRTPTIAEKLHPNFQALQASAKGGAGSRGCHLCTLLLRSLKIPETFGTVDEDRHIPIDEPVRLDVEFAESTVALVAVVGTIQGFPLILSTSDGQ